jgi:hypothetical protein
MSHLHHTEVNQRGLAISAHRTEAYKNEVNDKAHLHHTEFS